MNNQKSEASQKLEKLSDELIRIAEEEGYTALVAYTHRDRDDGEVSGVGRVSEQLNLVANFLMRALKGESAAMNKLALAEFICELIEREAESDD